MLRCGWWITVIRQFNFIPLVNAIVHLSWQGPLFKFLIIFNCNIHGSLWDLHTPNQCEYIQQASSQPKLSTVCPGTRGPYTLPATMPKVGKTDDTFQGTRQMSDTELTRGILDSSHIHVLSNFTILDIEQFEYITRKLVYALYSLRAFSFNYLP